MTWFKIDDKSAFHAKVMAAGNEAWGAVCRAGAWSSAHGTDGFIPDQIANTIAKKNVWKRAETCGEVGKHGLVDRVDGGWQIHDFLEWNPSAKEVEEKRASIRNRIDSWRKKRACNADCNTLQDALHNELQPRSDTCYKPNCNAAPVPSRSRPDPVRDSDPTDQGRAAAPVLVLEPTESKPARSTQRSLPLPKTPKPDTKPFWGIWRDKYRAKYGTSYRGDSGRDGKVMSDAVKAATEAAAESTTGQPDDAKLAFEHWVECYLAESSEFLERERHPFRCIMGNVTRYGTPWDSVEPEPGHWYPEPPKTEDPPGTEYITEPPPEFLEAIAKLTGGQS